MADTEPEQEFLDRNEQMRQIIDRLAEFSRSELNEFGRKAEIAREFDVVDSHIHYVLNHWGHLVEHRRLANSDPLDPEAVQAAYDDETLRAMAAGQPVPDGTGEITVPIELSLDKCFRCMKLLPGDLGLEFYTQTLEHAGEIPGDIGAILRSKQDE